MSFNNCWEPLALTLTRVKADDVCKEVCPRLADRPQLRWQQLMDVQDWKGLPMQSPPPHCDHKCHGIHQAAGVEVEQLVNCVHDLKVCDLYTEKDGDVNFRQWFCNATSFVFQVEL